MKVFQTFVFITTSILITNSFSAPITTIPWMGHKGAVSFTFDDALSNQIENLKPILDTMPSVKVTFFLTAMGNNLNSNAKGFSALALKGHEIGNHTQSHSYLTNITDENSLDNEIVQFASTIENTIENANVTAIATPYCSNNETVRAVINKRHFLNRDCGWTDKNSWDKEPAWLALMAKTWYKPTSTKDEFLKALDSTSTQFSTYGEWLVQLNHGVGNNTDDYGISSEDISAMFKRAVENDLWIAPFSTVGAYYKAHFTLDTTSAKETDNGFEFNWEIPHPYMPKSITVRIKLDDSIINEESIVEQNGKRILQNEDKTFDIEFNIGQLSVRKANETELSQKELSENDESLSIKIQRATKGNAKFVVFDVNGIKRLEGNSLQTIKILAKNTLPVGNYILKAKNKAILFTNRRLP